jgi:glucose-6-phosphate 1-epimerase
MTTALPDGVRLDQGAGRLVRLTINSRLCTGEMYLLGAHVCRWQPLGHPQPVLWMSGRSLFEPGRPIRGGVPICFPWFGPNASRPQAPVHGFARTQSWELVGVAAEPDGTIAARLSLASNDTSRAFDAAEFLLEYVVRFGATLDLSLTVTNTGASALRFEEALHTYLTVGDVTRVSVAGLDGAEYYDKTDGMTRKRQQGAVVIAAETDRLYVDTTGAITLDDPTLGRRVVVAKTGSHSSVVWNPWTAKSAAMPDFGDDEWTGMTCVETANAAENAIALDPGRRHTMTAAIGVVGR